MAELVIEGVSVRFGGIQALMEVDLAVSPGEVSGLIGPNGAGKTTLFNVITGLQKPNRGIVLLDDCDITSYKPHRRARLGIARTFQRLEIAGSLTTRENVQLAAEAQRKKLPGGVDSVTFAQAMLQRVGIGDASDQMADTLPTGMARLLEVARALATSPSILLLDEPSSGLNHAETDALAEVLRALATDGLGVLLVEHDMALVMEVCDQVNVLDFGEVIARGDPEEVQTDPVVQAAYLGAPTEPGPADVGGRAPARSGAASHDNSVPGPSEAAVRLDGVSASYGRIAILHDIDVEVPDGSAFAILGPNGAGKSSLLKVISGRLPPTRGTVAVHGQPVGKVGTARLARSGVCAVPEGRAIFPNLTVGDHLVMYTYRGRDIKLSDLEERTYARFPVLASRRRQMAGTLSGGEQQMLALARALFSEPRVLLLDEISMGLAPLVVAELYETVAQLAANENLTIIVVEQFAQTALAIADQAAIMVNGRIVQTGTPQTVADYVVDAYLS